ncbi:MAG TPA: GNAT family N-acetyltransferase [Ktedonobacteraceae bacterium]|jgi:GNAT superfamily N-acetyltransferase|nr:GNAT family N-acetyltransferase [Ktedonobacteraceae bacterium]
MMTQNISDLHAAMEENFLAYFLLGLVPLPHFQLFSDPELTWAVSSKFPGWNTVLRTQLSSETAAARVQALVDSFKSNGRPLGWLVLPSSRPVDLPSHLLANGLKQVNNRPHMLVDLHTLPAWADESTVGEADADALGAALSGSEGNGADQSAVGAVNRPPRVPAGLLIERVNDGASFAQWYRATVAGFEMTLATAEIYYEAYTRAGFDPAGPFLHYVGYLDGEPVTSSTLLLTDNMAGIYDVSTAPAVRGRGLGTAITLLPLLEARARGYRYACLQSSPEGYNVYRGLGFETQYHERIFAI